jgi:photosystem II stability/assembly factor-like uncharacterized protein
MKTKNLLIGAFSVAVSAAALFYASYSIDADGNVKTEDRTDFRDKKKAVYEPKGRAEWMALRRTTLEGETYEPGAIYAEYQKAMASASKRTERTLEDWVHRGPGNVGTRIRGIVVDAADPSNNTWLVASTGAGIWKTTDAGNTWTNLTANLPILVFTSITQCKSNPSVLYAGTGEDVFAGGSGVYGMGVFKSEDGGKTWNSLSSTVGSLDFVNVNDIIVSPTDPNIVVAATSSGFSRSTGFQAGIMRSTDGGKTWRKTYQTRSFPFGLTIDPNNPNVMYTGILFDGVAKTTDGGANWSLTSLGNIAQAHASKDPGRTEVAVHPKNSNLLIASMDYYDDEGGSDVFISEDAGRSWRIFEDDNRRGYDFIQQGIFDNCVITHTEDQTEFYVGGVLMTRNKITPNSTRTGPKSFLGLDKTNADWLLFINFGQQYMGGGLAIADLATAKNVEVRFGPGKKQMAHRFEACGGNYGAGCADANYKYIDMVEVPFEVWNVDDNKQLAIAFRDQEMNGRFNINPRDPNDTELLTNREYIYISSLEYTATPNPAMARNSGHRASNMYFFWPYLATGQTWNPTALPDSKIRFSVGSLVYQKGRITEMSDLFVNNTRTNPHPDHHVLVTIPKADGSFRLLSGNDGGLAYTDKAPTAVAADGSFNTVNQGGYNTGMSYTVSKKVGSNEYMTGMQDNDVYFSRINPTANSEWTSAQTYGDGMGVLYNATNGRNMLASRQYNAVRTSADGGVTWRNVTIRDNQAGTAPFVTKLESSDKAPDVVWAVGSSGVWKSTNFGTNFSVIRMGDGWGPSFGALEIRVSDKDPNVVWAGSTMAEGRGNIFLSTDGKSFKAVKNYVTGLSDANGNPVEMGNVSAIYPDPNDTKTAYLLFSQPRRPKILKTTNSGQTWTDLSGFGTAGVSSKGFPDVGVFSMLVFPDGKQIWVGTDIGLLESKDGGATWALANNGLPSVPIYDIRYRDKQIVVATHGLGIFSLDKTLEYKDDSGGGGGGGPTGLFDGTNAIAVKVYPNPTSDVVRFELPEVQGGSYSVSVFSVSGQKVLNKDVQRGGNVELSLGALNHGTYVIQAVSTDGKVYSQKVVVE